MSQQSPQFSLHRQLKPMERVHSLGRMVSSGISDVVIALIWIIIIIINHKNITIVSVPIIPRFWYIPTVGLPLPNVNKLS